MNSFHHFARLMKPFWFVNPYCTLQFDLTSPSSQNLVIVSKIVSRLWWQSVGQSSDVVSLINHPTQKGWNKCLYVTRAINTSYISASAFQDCLGMTKNSSYSIRHHCMHHSTDGSYHSLLVYINPIWIHSGKRKF